MRFYRRHAVAIFWIMVAIIYAIAILPAPQAPDLGAGDKINHIVAFLVLTVLGRSAYRQRAPWRLAVGLSLFGALIELTQAIPVLHRDASLWDWGADSAAILVALVIILMVEHQKLTRGPR